MSDLPGSQTIIPGTLYLVGTPIGNLGDLSPRAAAVLAGVDLIAAEDTRHTLRLLNHLGLRKHLESYHEHNRLAKTPVLADYLRQGSSVALVTDAGMPCISDPGWELVSLCAELGIPVTAVPGPCAAIVALAGSGMLTDRFVFEGFLPVPEKQRRPRLAEIAAEQRTLVLYEAPHRILRTLGDLVAAGLADRRLTLARELTKRHEEFLRMTVAEAAEHYRMHEPRGEYVLVLEGKTEFIRRRPADQDDSGLPPSEDDAATQALDQLRQCRDSGLTMKDAVRFCAARTQIKKNELYQMALTIWKDV